MEIVFGDKQECHGQQTHGHASCDRNKPPCSTEPPLFTIVFSAVVFVTVIKKSKYHQIVLSNPRIMSRRINIFRV